MPFISERVASMVRMTMADMADLADARPGRLRLENADAIIPPAPHVIAATRAAVGDDRRNSYLPLRGLPELRAGIAHRLREDFGLSYDLLEATGVALTPMVAWGADDFGRDHVRFIFTDEHEERLREAGTLVAEFVRGLAR